jgi:hypothetical protein
MTYTKLIRTALLTGLIALLLVGRTHAVTADEGDPVSVTGELTLIYADDFDGKRAELQYFIEDKQSKKQYRLQFDGTPPGHLRTGMKLTARGKAKGRKLFLAADGTSTESTGTVLPATTMVTGEQRTLVMVGNFNDTSVSCSVDEIRDIMFTDSVNNHVDALYQEMSQGEVTLSGDVIGPHTLNYASTDAMCDTAGWASALDAAALAQGIDPSTYTRKVYVLPSQNSCGWAGLGSLGGNPSSAWIMRCDIAGVYSHELGHNLGMHHASTPSNQYGDSSDGMGSSVNYLRKINAPHQEQMGWVPAYQIAGITESGTYDIAPLGIDPAQALAPQMLKILKPDASEYYYLSHRQPLGFDKNISSAYHGRTSIHTYTGDGSANRTFLLGKLMDGETYSDAINGITISQLSHTSNYVTVQIQQDASQPTPTCEPGTPQVSLSPPSQSTSAGDTLSYTVTITNTDNEACTASQFTLNPDAPSGWTASVSPSSLSLAPGTTGSASLTFTSSATAEAGTYAVGVAVSDSSEATHTAYGSASYTVVEACTATVPNLNLSPASQSGDPGTSLVYTLSLANNDSTACSDSTFDLSINSLPGGWNGSLSSSSLSLAPGATGTVMLSVSSTDSAAAGSYSLEVGAVDASESLHAKTTTATYVVNDTTPTTDTESPSAPTGLTASENFKQVSLSWSPSNDNVGVTGYQIMRDGMVIADVVDSSTTDTSGADGVFYEYSVLAYDAAGNHSQDSTPVTAGKAKGKGGGTTDGGGNKGKGKGSLK